MILDACRGLERPAVLATVVRVRGSAYRRPGARMLIRDDGATSGMVSGGCLEADLAERAQNVLRDRTPRTLVYDMRSPDDIVWGLGLGCDGEVRVLLERIDPAALPDWIAFVVETRERRGYGALATVFESPAGGDVGQRAWRDERACGGGAIGGDGVVAATLERAIAERRSRNETWGRRAGLVEAILPPVQLLLFGAGSDAAPMVEQGRRLGWRVRLFDQRESTPVDAERVDYRRLDAAALGIDERTAVILMTHHFLHDRTLLEALVAGPAGYVGVLGPRRRLDKLLDGLSLPAGARERLRGPVGLDIGSETPEEIALSATAEVLATFAGRHGEPLSGREGPLHDWPR